MVFTASGITLLSMRWVLSFGSQAKVIAPPELVKMLRKEVRAMHEG